MNIVDRIWQKQYTDVKEGLDTNSSIFIYLVQFVGDMMFQLIFIKVMKYCQLFLLLFIPLTVINIRVQLNGCCICNQSLRVNV